jgi:hypothetical protein
MQEKIQSGVETKGTGEVTFFFFDSSTVGQKPHLK